MYDVVDGDTIKVRGGPKRETVRLIGIDTPETRKPGTPVECGGREATSNMLALTYRSPADTDGDGLFDRENATLGVRVKLDTDRSQDFRDRYKRLLAYAAAPGFFPASRTSRYDLARKQLLAGWAEVYVFETNFRRVNAYESASEDASNANAGAWGVCDGDFHQTSR